MNKTDIEEKISEPIKYASFNIRFIASSIDMFIIMIFSSPIIEFIDGRMFVPINIDKFNIFTDPTILNDLQKFLPAFLQFVKENQLIERSIFTNLIELFFVAIYILPFWFYYSSTPGKMLFRLKIKDSITGIDMTHQQSIIRFIGYIISFLPLTLGFIWISLNKKKLGFHDMIAKTIVVVSPKKTK
ncbi:MAG: RDD family protein [Pseudomonadota bacterium]